MRDGNIASNCLKTSIAAAWRSRFSLSCVLSTWRSLRASCCRTEAGSRGGNRASARSSAAAAASMWGDGFAMRSAVCRRAPYQTPKGGSEAFLSGVRGGMRLLWRACPPTGMPAVWCGARAACSDCGRGWGRPSVLCGRSGVPCASISSCMLTCSVGGSSVLCARPVRRGPLVCLTTWLVLSLVGLAGTCGKRPGTIGRKTIVGSSPTSVPEPKLLWMIISNKHCRKAGCKRLPTCDFRVCVVFGIPCARTAGSARDARHSVAKDWRK